MPTTRAMRVRPPKITAAVQSDTTTPVTTVDTPQLVCTEAAIVLACTELKIRP